MELKIKILLEKLTQVISQSGMKHGLSGIHICRIIQRNKGSIFSQGTVSPQLILLVIGKLICQISPLDVFWLIANTS